MLLLFVVLISYPALSAACVSDFDCQLNGLCSAGSCVCDAPWAGANCGTLLFAPTTPVSGRSLIPRDDERNTWNGPIVTGPDGRFHLFAPLYPKTNLGQPTAILHGVADVITGPYDWASKPPVPPPVAVGINPAAVSYVDKQTNSTVFTLWVGGGVFAAADLDGPWHKLGEYPGVNPAPALAKDGTWFFTNQHTTQLFSAKSPGGPWSVFANISAALPADDYHVEDPFLYIDARGRFHIVNHAYSNLEFANCSRSQVSAHFYSEDGKVWAWAAQPYGHTVAYSDGSRHTFTTLERPNLHFDAAGRLTHINLAADLVTGDEGCANRTSHAHNGFCPCDNCKWDDLAGTTIIALAV